MRTSPARTTRPDVPGLQAGDDANSESRVQPGRRSVGEASGTTGDQGRTARPVREQGPRQGVKGQKAATNTQSSGRVERRQAEPGNSRNPASPSGQKGDPAQQASVRSPFQQRPRAVASRPGTKRQTWPKIRIPSPAERARIKVPGQADKPPGVSGRVGPNNRDPAASREPGRKAQQHGPDQPKSRRTGAGPGPTEAWRTQGRSEFDTTRTESGDAASTGEVGCRKPGLTRRIRSAQARPRTVGAEQPLLQAGTRASWPKESRPGVKPGSTDPEQAGPAARPGPAEQNGKPQPKPGQQSPNKAPSTTEGRQPGPGQQSRTIPARRTRRLSPTRAAEPADNPAGQLKPAPGQPTADQRPSQDPNQGDRNRPVPRERPRSTRNRPQRPDKAPTRTGTARPQGQATELGIHEERNRTAVPSRGTSNWRVSRSGARRNPRATPAPRAPMPKKRRRKIRGSTEKAPPKTGDHRETEPPDPRPSLRTRPSPEPRNSRRPTSKRKPSTPSRPRRKRRPRRQKNSPPNINPIPSNPPVAAAAPPPINRRRADRDVVSESQGQSERPGRAPAGATRDPGLGPQQKGDRKASPARGASRDRGIAPAG